MLSRNRKSPNYGTKSHQECVVTAGLLGSRCWTETFAVGDSRHPKRCRLQFSQWLWWSYKQSKKKMKKKKVNYGVTFLLLFLDGEYEGHEIK
ncbi:uncharacterized protein RSE6_11542 [Rhynchosporium secalis]|uniref:Uncharacterized protein n=1 Tax=Rhynchosporium secalis TaxID=38038 RepID=A0A1E1MP62_RHYSE|nr:uncharacterized protein RSE6_11542 [Rhynchosporium secalis]